MRLMEGRYQETVGVWEEADGLIIVKRTQLRSSDAFAAPCCTSYRPERPWALMPPRLAAGGEGRTSFVRDNDFDP
jgi:hypothetical protein